MKCETALKVLAKHRAELRTLKVKSLAIFGSVARNEARKGSDIDIIIEFSEAIGYFHFFDVKTFLERILKCKVDLVTADAVRPEFREQIEKEKINAA